MLFGTNAGRCGYCYGELSKENRNNAVLAISNAKYLKGRSNALEWGRQGPGWHAK